MGLKGRSGPIARRYARAVLDVAMASASEVEGPARVRASLEGAVGLLESQPELERALTHPAIPPEARKRVVFAVWASAPELVKRLLEMLAARDRIPLLSAITAAYVEAWNEARGVASAQAESAVALDAGQKAALVEALQEASGKKVELEVRLDPALLAGLRVKLGGRTFDGSVRAQLQALRRSLRGAA